MKATCIAAVLLLTAVTAASAQKPQPPAAKSAPTSISLKRVFAREQLLLDAVTAGDVAGFNRLAAGRFTYIDGSGIVIWTPAMSEMLKKCTTGPIATEDVRTQRPVDGVIILSYKATLDQTCDGKKSPSPVAVMSVWQRTAKTWKLAAHSETPLK